MTKEIWRDIEGYEGLYQVSDQGRVKSLERTFIDKIGRERYFKGRILKPAPNGCGYLSVNLYDCGKKRMFLVHRLVCQAFHKNPNNKSEVNHINEDKADNRASNLEWCTRTENCNYGTRNKRAGEGIAKALSKPIGQYTIDGGLVKAWASLAEVKRQTGFSKGNISQVTSGKLKTAYGYIWKYI